jgi:hypothetical protein
MRGWNLRKIAVPLALCAVVAWVGMAAVCELQGQELEGFNEFSKGELEKARATVRQRIAAFKERLARDPAEIREGWISFMLTDSMERQLAANRINAVTERKIRERILSGKAGLDFSPVVALRQSYLDFGDLREMTSQSDLPQYFAGLQGRVREKLVEYEKTASPFTAAEISKDVRFLRRARQAPRLLSSIDSQYDRENFLAQASRRLVAAGIEQPVDETSAISDVMLGVSIQGVARMTGQVTLEFTPSTEHAALELLLNGHAFSSNTGRKRSVTVMSTGTTSISARKSLSITDLGLSGSPAVAACATASSIDGIDAKCGLVERLAWKKARQSQGQAEALASSKAEARIEQRVDEQAQQMFTEANQSFRDKFRRPLIGRDGLPKSLRLGTTVDKLLVHWLQRRPDELGADTAPPPFEGEADLAVRVHQSYVSNFSAAVIGGMKLTDERLAELVKQATGDVPEELRIDDDKDAWSITFAEKSPLSVRILENGMITVTVDGDSFTRNDRHVPDKLRMSATYKYEKTPTGAKFIRQGDVAVDFAAEKVGIAVGIKPLMSRKFAALFKPEIDLKDIKLPGRWEKAGKLQVIDFNAAQQWISVAWNLVPRSADETTEKTPATAGKMPADADAAIEVAQSHSP